jgi:hypothetical protein
MDTSLEEIEKIDKEFEAEILREKLNLKKNIIDARKLLLQIDSVLLKKPTNTDAKEQKEKIVRYVQRQEKSLYELEHGAFKPEIPAKYFAHGERYVDFAGRDGIYNPSISRYFNFNFLLDNYNDIHGIGTSIFKQFEDSINYAQPPKAYAITIELKQNGMYLNVYNHSDWNTSIGHISLHSGFNLVGLSEDGVSHYKDINGNTYPIGMIRKSPRNIEVYFEGRPGQVFPPEGIFLIQIVNELFNILIMNGFLRTNDTANKYLSYKEKYLLYKRKYLNLKLINK